MLSRSAMSVRRVVAQHLQSIMEEAQELKKAVGDKVKAPYVRASMMTLGGPERPSVVVTVSFDSKDDWPNKILENSRYAKLMFNFDSRTLEYISGNDVEKLRKTKFKDVNDAITKLSKWVAAQ